MGMSQGKGTGFTFRDEGGAGSFGAPYWLHMDWPEGADQGGNTIQYEGWVPYAAQLTSVRVMMMTVNTVGTYTLALTNVATAAAMLVAATFDMNALAAATVTDLALTVVAADLVLAQAGRWTLALVSNNVGFDGSGIYIELMFVGT